MILRGAYGPDAAIHFRLTDAAGADIGTGAAGRTWLTSELDVALPGAQLAAATTAQIARIIYRGGNSYELQLTNAETNAATGSVLIRVKVAAAQEFGQTIYEEIVEVATTPNVAAMYLGLSAQIGGTDSISDVAVSAGAAAKIAQAVRNVTIVGTYSMADLARLEMAMLAGPVTDFMTGTQVYRCPVTNKIRATITTTANGRTAPVIGDLT